MKILLKLYVTGKTTINKFSDNYLLNKLSLVEQKVDNMGFQITSSAKLNIGSAEDKVSDFKMIFAFYKSDGSYIKSVEATGTSIASGVLSISTFSSKPTGAVKCKQFIMKKFVNGADISWYPIFIYEKAV
jgi:hypothetical protein